MKKFFCKTFLIFSFFISALTFASCQVEWFGDIEQDLDEKLTGVVCFYLKNPETQTVTTAVEKKYLIGTKLTQDDFPKNGSVELKKICPGFEITEGNWKGLNTPSIGVEYLKTLTSDIVEELIVPPRESGFVELYLDYNSDITPKETTEYTIIYRLQNIYDNDFTEVPSPETGRTDASYAISSINSYQQLVDDNAPYQIYPSAADEQITVAGDGSAEKTITLARKMREITFSVNSISSANESFIDIPPAIDDSSLGIMNGPVDPYKYLFIRRHGFEYNKLTINKIVPQKTGYHFYGWNTTEIKVCDDTDDPYSFVTDFPETMESDVNYYPVWGPIPFNVYITGPAGSDLPITSDSIGSIPIYTDDSGKKYIKISNQTKLPELTLPDSYDTTLVFGGYKFTSSDGNLSFGYLQDASNNYYVPDGTSLSEDGNLIAVWEYENIYLDPVHGNDNNDAMSPATAIKTPSRAIPFVNVYGKSGFTHYIVLMDKLTTEDDINSLPGVCGFGAVIKRGPGTNGTLIEIPSGATINFRMVTFYGANIEAYDAFIKNNGTLNLGNSVFFDAIKSNSNSGMGAAINNTGIINIQPDSGYTVTFRNTEIKSGGLIYNHNRGDGTTAECNINSGEIRFENVQTTANSSLQQKAVLAYFESGTLTFKGQMTCSSTNPVIALNKGVKVYVGSDFSTDIPILALNLSDYTSGETQILYNLAGGGTDYVSQTYSRFSILGSTYDPATLTAGWTINSTGYLVYNVFTGGSIVLPTDFKAKVGISFVDPNSMSYYSESQSTSVKTTSITNKIFIGIKIWYLNDTLDSNLVVDASGSGLTSISNANFANLEVKLLYNGVDTGAHLSGGGFVLGNTTWPAGEYVIKVSFSYAGLPYSYSIPFTATNP